MAFEQSYRNGPPDVAITVRWAGRSRSLRMSRWVAGVLLGVVPLVAGWYLCATLYMIFHDQLLASLMARQTDMQYSYEDRIATLKTDLDRQTSRALIERQALDTTIRELGERGSRLEARASTIESLVANGSPAAAMATHASPRGIAGSVAAGAALSSSDVGGVGEVSSHSAHDPQAAAPDFNIDRSRDSSSLLPGEDGDRLSMEPRTVQLASAFSRVEGRQDQIVARLRDPAIRAVARMQVALADTGLPPSRWQLPVSGGAGVGGPYVPLPTSGDAAEFDRSVEILRDAAVQYRHLSEIIDRVPLHRPLEGPLEVTSTFGARLDPFLGRPAMHTGIDLHESYGDAVTATAAGTVTIAGSEGGYGNMVEIDHGDGLTTRYAHLASITVALHQRVKCGDLVGHVGMTGRTTGPHLHYETRINGEPVNPARFIKAGLTLFP